MDHSVSTATPVRDLAMDFYRVIAITFVVLGHWLVAALTYRNGQFGRGGPTCRAAMDAMVDLGVPGGSGVLRGCGLRQCGLVDPMVGLGQRSTASMASAAAGPGSWDRRRWTSPVGLAVVAVLLAVGVHGPLAFGGGRWGMRAAVSRRVPRGGLADPRTGGRGPAMGGLPCLRYSVCDCSDRRDRDRR